MEKTMAVIGGGAAGMLCAGRAAELGARVSLYERNDRCGRKLRITGKGRCNVTNDCAVHEFLENVPRNPTFLYSALYGFTPTDTMAFFESLGVPLKVERGRRVFPVSDDATDIVDALRRYAADAEMVHARVRTIEKTEDGFIVTADGAPKRTYDCVVIATGGASYPRTGSDGDGYAFARALGHTVTDLRPSLVPMESRDGVCRELMGLSLRNVGFSVRDDATGKTVYRDFGELLFAHFGLTGPTVLSASAHLPDLGKKAYTALIDLKPALNEKELDQRILRDFSKFANRDFKNALDELLPQKMITPVIDRSGILPHKKVNEVTRAERAALVSTLKSFTVSLSGFRPIDEAIVTSGGVSVREIDPGTMQSKKVSGLYFAGEVIDVDAYTGGYNLQIAFSTARLAAESAAET